MLRERTWVLIVDPDAEIARALASALAEREVGVVHATTAVEAMSALAGTGEGAGPSHAILELDLPDAPGERVVESLERRFPRARVIALASRAHGVRALTLAGRCTYVPKNGVTAADLLGALDRIAAPGLDGFVATNGLSQREHAVLLCMTEGLTVAGMADRLQCRVSTIKTYIQRIFDKTGRGSQVELLGLLVEWLTASEAERSQLGTIVRSRRCMSSPRSTRLS